MARMTIRVSGQRQKHGTSLADEIAKLLLRFSGDHLPPSTALLLQNTLPQPSPPPATAAAVVIVVVAAITVIMPSLLPLLSLSSCRCRRRPRVLFRCCF